jgi:predicted nucleotidyltransferase component of viral defense system
MKTKSAFLGKIREVAKDISVPPEKLERHLAHLVLTQVWLQNFEDTVSLELFKGGTAIAWQVDFAISRPTVDLDASSSESRAEVAQRIVLLNGQKWGPFELGTPKIKTVRVPTGIDYDDALVVARVPIRFRDSRWLTVTLEIAPNCDLHLGENILPNVEMREILVSLDLPSVTALPVISIERQMAEKLHALTAPGSDRGKDLYDLCLVDELIPFEMPVLALAVKQVFEERASHAWGDGFDLSAEVRAAYRRQAGQFATSVNFDDALARLQRLKKDIDACLDSLG